MNWFSFHRAAFLGSSIALPILRRCWQNWVIIRVTSATRLPTSRHHDCSERNTIKLSYKCLCLTWHVRLTRTFSMYMSVCQIMTKKRLSEKCSLHNKKSDHKNDTYAECHVICRCVGRLGPRVTKHFEIVTSSIYLFVLKKLNSLLISQFQKTVLYGVNHFFKRIYFMSI